MNSDERIRVSQLAYILDALKISSPAMPLQHAISFLHITLEPGLSISELARAAQVPIASASRHVKALAGSGPGSHNPALVTSGFVKDERTKAILLTDAGRSLLGTVLDSLSGTPVPKPDAAGSPAPCPNNGRMHTRRAPPQRIPWDPFEGC
jgi:DNA-binding MarR family transcriptional regulator